MIELILLLIGIPLSIYLAFKSNKKREEKFEKIDHECHKIIKITEEIIKRSETTSKIPRIAYHETYQKGKEISPFMTYSKLADSIYIKFDISIENELIPNYFPLLQKYDLTLGELTGKNIPKLY